MRLAILVLLAGASVTGALPDRTDALALLGGHGRTSILPGRAGEPDVFTRVISRGNDGTWGSESPTPPLRGVPFRLRDTLWTASEMIESGGRRSYLLAPVEQALGSAHRVEPVEGATSWTIVSIDGWSLLLMELLGDGALVARRIVTEGSAGDLDVAVMIEAGRWPAGSRLDAVDARPDGSFVAGGRTPAGTAIVTRLDASGELTTLEQPMLRGERVAVAHAGASPIVFAAGEGRLTAMSLDAGAPSDVMALLLEAGDVVTALKAAASGDRALAIMLVERPGVAGHLVAATSEGRSLVRESVATTGTRAPEPSASERFESQQHSRRMHARLAAGVVVCGLLLALFILLKRLAALRR